MFGSLSSTVKMSFLQSEQENISAASLSGGCITKCLISSGIAYSSVSFAGLIVDGGGYRSWLIPVEKRSLLQ